MKKLLLTIVLSSFMLACSSDNDAEAATDKISLSEQDGNCDPGLCMRGILINNQSSRSKQITVKAMLTTNDSHLDADYYAETVTVAGHDSQLVSFASDPTNDIVDMQVTAASFN